MEKKGYKPPLCVWKVVEDSASPEKHSIIRSLVGISKLEYAADLRNELETLIEIWNELNCEAIPARYHPQTHLGLPEPPKQREMLVAEIHLLLENLKDKDNGGLGYIPNDCREDVISYTNHIMDQRTPTPTTPLLQGTPNSTLNDGEIVDVAKNIPILDNETPIKVLQSALQCECDMLADDIEYVRRCVEEGRCDFEEIPEPSLLDLKNERKKLEKHLIQSIEINPIINPPSNNVSKKSIPRIRPSTPVPKRKNLPPLRPTSAVQYSMINREAIRQYGEMHQTVQPEIPLGGRSNTDPSGSVIKIPKELKRPNSTSAIPICKASSGRSSPFEHDLTSNRKQFGVFCGTPDSGVSSRPVSELGIIDTTIINNTSETVTDLAEMKINPDKFNPEQVIMTKQCTSVNISENASGGNPVVYKYNIKKPQPPIHPRPSMHGKRSMHSAKFHKIKASGNGDL